MRIEDVLYEKFGYRVFRIGQKKIIEDLLRGVSVVAMLPTGGGKSVCYQVPGYMMHGTVLIVSPLLSLMEDQVNQLRLIGEKRVIAFNSFRTMEEKREAIRNLSFYKFIFASPEMLQARSFLYALKQMNIALFVVDEAHCISQWGYDFRPDYKKLDHVIQELGNPAVLALTATATREVLEDIAHSLQLTTASFHLYSVDRPNIALQVEHVETLDDKKERVLLYASQLQGPGIIYCSSRSWAEALAQALRASGTEGVAYYHGGMEQEERMLIQQQFMKGQLSIIVCTSAFGMGINKPDVRYIIHFHYPSNLESYLQEIGRAGRDGGESIAILLFCTVDHELPLSLIQEELPNERSIAYCLSLFKEELIRRPVLLLSDAEYIARNVAGFAEQHWRFLQYRLEQIGAVNGKELILEAIPSHAPALFYERVIERLNQKYEKLQGMRSWLEGSGCRRESLLRFFDYEKESAPKQCCDVCGIMPDAYKKNGKSGTLPYAGWREELKQILSIGETEAI